MTVVADITSLVPTIETLPNGVTLLNAPTPSPNVGVMLIVRSGSRDETAATAGLAHFLEHLFFKGTTRRPTTQEISREIDRVGGYTNAHTDTEEVAYYGEGPATALHELTDVITDMLSHPLFLDEEVQRERNVVLQELAGRLRRPDGWIYDRLPSVAFGGDQPMSWSAAGFPEIVARVSRDELVAHHDSFYSPKRMALVISGGDRLSSQDAAAMLADVPEGSPRPRQPAVWGQGERYIANIQPAQPDEPEQIDLALAWPGFPALDSDRNALTVMSQVLGGGMSSRLFLNIREREGLCYRIHARHEAYEDSGLFEIGTATQPEHAERTVRLASQELRRLAAELVETDELNAAKTSWIGRLYRGTETAGSSAEWYASRWRAGLPLETPAQRAAAIEAVTAHQVQHVAQRIMERFDQVRLSLWGPKDQGNVLLEAVLTA